MPLENPFEVLAPPKRDSAVIASAQPLPIGHVLEVGFYRYIIQYQISKGTFDRLLAANVARNDGVSGNCTLNPETCDVDDREKFKVSAQPDFEPGFYYKMEVFLK